MTTMKQRFGMLPTKNIQLAPNVRRQPVNVDELVDSVKRYGIIEPLIVYAVDSDTVEVIAGQRRLAAAKAAGLPEVPCLLRPKPSERDRLLMQLAENLDREDMTPIEEAVAFARLVDQGLKQQEICKCVNRSVYFVSTRLQLLALPDLFQDAIHARTITAAVALSMPKPLLEDAAAMKRCARRIGDGDTGLRAWAYDEVHRRSRNGHATTASYQLNTPFSLPVAYVELAQAAAGKKGIPTKEWVRDAIRAAARRQGLDLPDGADQIETKTRLARRRS